MLSSLYASERRILILTTINHAAMFGEGSNDEEPIGCHKPIRDEGLFHFWVTGLGIGRRIKREKFLSQGAQPFHGTASL